MHQQGVPKVTGAHDMIKHEVFDKPQIKVILSKGKDGAYHIGLPIDGMNAFMPVQFTPFDKHRSKTEMIGDALCDSHPSSLAKRQQQQQIGLSFSEFFMDYDEVGEVYRNRRFQGASSSKQYMVNKMGIFTSMNHLKQIVWKFPVLDLEDLVSWRTLDDNRKWPVYVMPPPNTLYPSDFGRGTAIRWKPGQNGGRVFAVVKEPLDETQFNVEIPKYYGQIYQVPEFMVCARSYGVLAIDKSDNSITFLRRNQNPLICTINEVRSMPRGSVEYKKRMQALVDVINDYPVQLADLLNPGEIQASKAYRESQDGQSEESTETANEESDNSPLTNSSGAPSSFTPGYNASASSLGGNSYSPTPNLQARAQQQQQRVESSINDQKKEANPFYSRAMEVLNEGSDAKRNYSVTHYVRP